MLRIVIKIISRREGKREIKISNDVDGGLPLPHHGERESQLIDKTSNFLFGAFRLLHCMPFLITRKNLLILVLEIFLIPILSAYFFPILNFVTGVISPIRNNHPAPSTTTTTTPHSPSPPSTTTTTAAAITLTTPPPPTATTMTSWFQKQFTLPPRSRGSYLITDYVLNELPEIKNYKVGLLHLFIQHTSCALSLNENWDEDVREDMSDALDRIVPVDRKGNLYRHSAEGEDDMPAHIKSALIGASVTIPISNGRLATGTWQGIWYLEFRASRHTRRVVATIQGEKA
ncbi:UPF0047 domain protein [Rasamsonia emersonii CBS 393.64]|uniref:UPF0047 domain protein n=1 Tax=Rasamsonia emersonii (strain ATCC 16479 / CBS 393.64 / IMI 116815) TaxID=1408163 RepID=A0A0F4YQW3_RASE3|nr:UPF0047 domain protein [Rasamsonia emersonii CBS 393.64]KKA20028.1 UPF0047 domain protein [Rasamsonia emersonii CBS 393.64]